MTVRAHEKTHLNIQYKCDLCGSSFRVKAYLTAHVQKVHMKLKKWVSLVIFLIVKLKFLIVRFKCSIENCSASFVHRELLNYHVRKHLNIRNFACKYCGKTFVTNSCCKIHERFVCHSCCFSRSWTSFSFSEFTLMNVLIPAGKFFKFFLIIFS